VSRSSYQKALQIQFEVFFVRSRRGVHRKAFLSDLWWRAEVPTKKRFKSNLRCFLSGPGEASKGVSFRFVVASQGSYQKALQIQFEVFFVRSRRGVHRKVFLLDLWWRAKVPTKKRFKSNLRCVWSGPGEVSTGRRFF